MFLINVFHMSNPWLYDRVQICSIIYNSTRHNFDSLFPGMDGFLFWIGSGKFGKFCPAKNQDVAKIGKSDYKWSIHIFR